jgi:hypothetical protein
MSRAVVINQQRLCTAPRCMHVRLCVPVELLPGSARNAHNTHRSCVTLEQEREGLRERLVAAGAALESREVQQGALAASLAAAGAERDQAVRLNLKLQAKLAAMEDDAAAATKALAQSRVELDEAHSQATVLGREHERERRKLVMSVDKLAARCDELQRERDRAAAEAARQKAAGAVDAQEGLPAAQ